MGHIKYSRVQGLKISLYLLFDDNVLIGFATKGTSGFIAEIDGGTNLIAETMQSLKFQILSHYMDKLS